jgi:hypothetical protein
MVKAVDTVVCGDDCLMRQLAVNLIQHLHGK